MIGYKLFKIKNNDIKKIYPLYVDANHSVPIGEWVEAKEGEKTIRGKVKSKLGELCYRPGWHLTDIPYVTHIGKKDEEGKIAYLPEDLVWAEVEYSDELDYQPVADKNGLNSKGKVIMRNAYLTEVPRKGFYRYKTNPLMYGTWIIAGEIKVNRILSDQEVLNICHKHGLSPLPRWDKDMKQAI